MSPMTYEKRGLPRKESSSHDQTRLRETANRGKFNMAQFVNGCLVFSGRSDDMMIFDGMNIYPAEIESALLEHPAVCEAASFPLKHERFQDVPVAAVVLRMPADLEDLEKHCARVLGVKRPRMIRVLDSFPVNAMGKTLKRDLRAEFLKSLASNFRGDEVLGSKRKQ
jgi:acyl-CoA synthetase (AMP-forming)/AMP-acid ligase II